MEKIYLAILILGLGTYLIRVLPLIWGKNANLSNSNLQSILKYLGPCLIASLLVSSIPFPKHFSWFFALKLFFSLGIIGASNYFFKNVGLSVFIGIICYAGLEAIAKLLFR